MAFLLKQGTAQNYLRRGLAAVDKTGDRRMPTRGLIDRLSAGELDCSGCSEPTWTGRTSPASCSCG
jgi:hypothetical protein